MNIKRIMTYIMVLMFSFTDAMSQGIKMTPVKQVPERHVVSSNKGTVTKASTQNATNKIVRGDLGIFELEGPVKSFTFKNEWGTTKRTFDRNGVWLTIDGKPLKTVYQKGMKRDAKGRLVKGIMDIDGNGEEYTYNAEGKVVKYYYHYFDTTEEDTYTYDSNGKLLKKHVVQGGMDAMEPYTETYEIVSKDKHGNWTKRNVITGSERAVETRTIVYYE